MYWYYIAAIADYHALNGLQQHSFIISLFCRSEIWWAQLVTPLHVLKAYMKLQAGLCSFLEAVGDRASEFIQVVGRIPFFDTEELRSLFLCWMLGGWGGHTQLVGATGFFDSWLLCLQSEWSCGLSPSSAWDLCDLHFHPFFPAFPSAVLSWILLPSLSASRAHVISLAHLGHAGSSSYFKISWLVLALIPSTESFTATLRLVFDQITRAWECWRGMGGIFRILHSSDHLQGFLMCDQGWESLIAILWSRKRAKGIFSPSFRYAEVLCFMK